MTYKEDIEKKYANLLGLAQKYDACFEGEPTTWGSPKLKIKADSEAQYWEIRAALEAEIPLFMNLLRKAMLEVPALDRKYTMHEGADSSGEEYSTKVYINENYGSLVKFFDKIEGTIENAYSGAIVDITQNKLIKDDIRNMRGSVLCFTHVIDLFLPENILTIDKEVEISLKLRELGLDKVADELDAITEKEANDDKCKNARTALEMLVVDFCEKNGIKLASLFHHNLALAIEKGMTEKTQQKSISTLYSFTSKIVHKEIEATQRNTLYAINGIYNIIGSLISQSTSKSAPKEQTATEQPKEAKADMPATA